MRSLIVAAALLFCLPSFAQPKLPAKNYPSLLWEITGNGLTRPSYLFGTMHVSNKMVFHLSDSFYIGIRNADVVALETNMGTWQEDFSRYDLEGGYNAFRTRGGSPEEYMTISTLQYTPYDKKIELALNSSPAMINNFLYRNNSDRSSDFEEDTYLDMHIYQTGKKWGKKVCGVEDFDRSMELMKEAYIDAAKETRKRERSYGDNEFSYSNMEEAYRSGNLDLLDTINKVNSSSAAFDEKFVYLRNLIQANSIDSILKTKAALFVGVGAAHLPGQRGVIEILRSRGYKLRPIFMSERDGRQKDEVEKIRVPVPFSRQSSNDGFFSVNMPGKLYDFSDNSGQQQFADMSNGSYYMVSRVNTNSLLWGHSEDAVLRRIDSLVYENVPGKILTKQAITRNGYKGFEVTNRTRRGDFQRYNIFVTPFEIIVFKMSGNGDYVKDGTEANQFFNSIELRPFTSNWAKWSPPNGGFTVELPHTPLVTNDDNWQFMAQDNATGTGFEVIRTDLHNYDFAEEDSFDLNLMAESFASSDFIDREVSRRHTVQDGYAALDARYKYKDGSLALVRFMVQGPHYYTLVAHAKTENPKMQQFIHSFRLTPFVYASPLKQTDTSLYFTVTSPVPLQRSAKISLVPNIPRAGEEDALLPESNIRRERLVVNDSTGEKIYVSFMKPRRYYFDNDTASASRDTLHFKTPKQDWTYRQRKTWTEPNNTRVLDYILGDPKSSRYVHGKLFSREGVETRIETEGDTLTKPGAFITGFFNSFQPSDTVQGLDVKKSKSPLFFADFFSKDTVLHKRAIKNVGWVVFDSSDLGQMKLALSSLNWKDKRYIDAKKLFIRQLATVKSRASADYLGELYYAAGDTVEIQYAVLFSLLQQKTDYSFQTFGKIMVNDPPVLDDGVQNNLRFAIGSPRDLSSAALLRYRQLSGNYSFSANAFMPLLSDSLRLTGTIFKDLLPLINVHDYEQPMMNLTAMLVDSNIIGARDYEAYQSKFLIEARQQMKKQVIKEKNSSIKKAQAAGTDDDNDDDVIERSADQGNAQLSLYASLLMPFWDRTPAVPQLMNQLLASSDKRLKFNTALLMLQYGKPLPDTLLGYYAATDEYRYELFRELKERKKENLFPAAYNHHVDLAKSKLLGMTNRYAKPDSLVFIDRLPAQCKDGGAGFVYFFKYKQKKADNSWKLASIGLVPADPKRFEFGTKKTSGDDDPCDFSEITETRLKTNEPIKDQLVKALKKLQYAKRNSAVQFYSTDRRGMDFLRNMRF
jgi:uncharacterized protein YbaP (TraB family)